MKAGVHGFELRQEVQVGVLKVCWVCQQLFKVLRTFGVELDDRGLL
jgi:hypothetical protein